MDGSESHMNVNLGKTDSTSLSRDGLHSTSSELTFRKEERGTIGDDEGPPISSGPGGKSTTAQTGAQKQEPKQNIGNRSRRKSCLLCLVTFALVAIVAGLSIYELKCPHDWKENEHRCYFISTMGKSYDGATEHCSKFDASLLDINSNQKENFLLTSAGVGGGPYWIGKCRDGNVIHGLLFKILYGEPSCSKCLSTVWAYRCGTDHRFICEKSLHLYPDIPEEIRGLCQQPAGGTSVN